MTIAEQRAFILGLTYALGLVEGFRAVFVNDVSALAIGDALKQGIASARIVLDANEHAGVQQP